MNEYQSAERLSEPLTVLRGFQMFKEHVSSMKSGSRLLGGEQGTTDYEEDSGQN